jgi:hypothetical protein
MRRVTRVRLPTPRGRGGAGAPAQPGRLIGPMGQREALAPSCAPSHE